MVTVEELRLALRLSNGALGQRDPGYPGRRPLDLRAAGVRPGEGDALVRQAVKLYARWQFDFCGQGERYRQAYESPQDLPVPGGGLPGGGRAVTDLVKLLLLEPVKNELAEELWKPGAVHPHPGRIASVSRAERLGGRTGRASPPRRSL